MLFLAVGGTIDKQAVYLPDGSFDQDSKVFGDTHLPEMLTKSRFLGEYTLQQLFMIDSLDMTDEHREKIAVAAAESPESQIIITHGTDTMPETARFLRARRELAAKTIVLTGAMLPYSVGAKSEALFNVGSSIAYVQALASGIYIVMNGQAFQADNVRKDLEAGVFRTIH